MLYAKIDVANHAILKDGTQNSFRMKMSFNWSSQQNWSDKICHIFAGTDYENWTEVVFVSIYLVMLLGSVQRWIRSPLLKVLYITWTGFV